MTQPGGLSSLPLSDEEIIEFAVQIGMSEQYARFVLAMERGEIGPDGDVVFVDGDEVEEEDEDEDEGEDEEN